MKHVHYKGIEEEKVEIDGAEKTVIRHVITEKDGAPTFNFRVLSIEPGGASPSHTHPWEHEFFVLSGEGVGEMDGKEATVKPGDVLYVPPDVQHCIRATTPMEVI